MTAPRWARRRTASVLLLCSVLAVGMPLGANADPLGDARAKAETLRHKVADLRAQAEMATEAYDEAYAQLGVAVTNHLTAERDLAQAEATSGASNDVAGRRVRALYMSGGTAALYAAVLNSASIAEVAQRITQVQVVLAADDRVTRLADHAVAGRRDAEQRLAAAAAASTALQKQVAARSDAVTTLLAQADALLSSADAQVLSLAAAQNQADEQTATAQAQTTLAAARAALGNLPEAPPTKTAADAIAWARTQLGKPYVWGATGPDTYDCSGLTGAAYRTVGVALPRTSRQQWYVGTHIALGALQPGDLLFWAFDVHNPATIHHVALYVGGGMMIAAPHTGDRVKLQGVFLDGFAGAVRPVSS